MSDRNNAVPGLFTILNQVVDGLATRLQIASIELSVAKNNAAKTAIYAVLAALFGLFALVFYIGRTSCYFLGRSPHFRFLLHCRRLSAPVPFLLRQSPQPCG